MNSESVKNLLPALAAAIADMPDPKKNAKNDHFKNRYADLGAVLECVFAPLANNGLVMTQTVHTTEVGDILCTRIWHVASGEWLESNVPLRPEKATPQGMASAITYARRYAIKALFGMVDVDDDGNDASGRPARPARQERGMPTFHPSSMEIEAGMREADTAEDLEKWAGYAAKVPDHERPALRKLYADRRVVLDSLGHALKRGEREP